MRFAMLFLAVSTLASAFSLDASPIKNGAASAKIARRDLKSETASYTLKGLSPTDFKPEDIRVFHAQHVVSFLNAPSNGMSRMTEIKAFPTELYTQASDEQSKRRYRLARNELIGIAMHSKPVAYRAASEHQGDQKNKILSSATAPTRMPDEFEAEALKKLSDGQDLASLENPGELRIVGAIRATQDCLACHECKVHDLLGAFTFRLLDEDAFKKEFPGLIIIGSANAVPPLAPPMKTYGKGSYQFRNGKLEPVPDEPPAEKAH